MTEEHKTVALWIRKHAEQLIEALPARQKVAQVAEDREAKIVGRMPQMIRFEPLVEIPTPVLAAILAEVKEETETVASYRKHCEMWPDSGTTNVRADQLLKVLDAAGLKEQATAPALKLEKTSA
jgi:hypothetical protein